ncbi:MAG: V-type ATPase subunit [Treponema sp.]|jgi:vacuolar-type H+-ATPase subunit C/Vma6|nr:V-type ATPase subunit [Treponema sp.]
MSGAGERAYVYAKACGIVGKSLLGRRMPALARVDRLAALDRLIFPQGSRELPERELLPDLERRITGRAVSQILSIVSSFSRPPELLLRLLRTWEYADLKASLNALVSGEPSFPRWTNLGAFGTVRFTAYPDLEAMVKGTEFEFLLDRELNLERGGDAIKAQTELDKQFYASLWRALKKLPKKDRTVSERILGEEISLRNCIWALRLRTYYGMTVDEVSERLMDIYPFRAGKPKVPGKAPGYGKGSGHGKVRRTAGRRAPAADDSLAADARISLGFALDSRPAWTGWRREQFLNPELPGRPWTADPRYFQNSVGEYLYKLALHSFRRRPFSIDTAFCFIRLKQYEEDLLTSVAEGLGLGMSSQDVFALLEVT